MLSVRPLVAANLNAPYATKPDWWDSIKLAMPPETDLKNPASAWVAISKTNDPWQKLVKNWRVIGPFDGANGKNMAVALMPEKANATATMPGKGGAPVSWKEWKDGAACPVPAELSDAIVYGFKELRIDKPMHVGMVFEASGRYKVWIDGQAVIPFGQPNEYASVNCDWVPGKHQVVLKLDAPSGRWSFRSAIVTNRPELVEIRARTGIAKRWSSDTNAVMEQGVRIAALYATIDDEDNFRHWMVRALAPQNDPTRLVAVASAWNKANMERPAMAAVCNATLLEHLVSLREKPALRDALGEMLLRSMSLAEAEAGVRQFHQAGYLASSAQSQRFIDMCIASNRIATLPYWVESFCNREPPTGVIGKVLGDAMNKASDLAREKIYAGIEQAIVLGSKQNRGALAVFYGKTAAARGELGRLNHLPAMGDGFLCAEMPFDAAMWNLDAARMDLDQDRARAALAAAAKARPNYENSKEYHDIKVEIFKMRAATAMPAAVLTDLDDVVQTSERYARQNELERLNSYIRRMLAERGQYVVGDNNDNNLFHGAKALYRSQFAAYAAGYASYLAREATAAASRPGGEMAAEHLRRCAALMMPPVAPPEVTPPPLLRIEQLSPITGVFGGVAQLPPAMEETLGEDTRALLGAWQPMLAGAAVDADGVVVVQNSRGIAASADGKLRWNYVAALHTTATPYGYGYGGLTRPAHAGDMVVARLETFDGHFQMYGFDLRSGQIRWHWSGQSDDDEPVGAPAVWRNQWIVFPVLRRGADNFVLDLVVAEAASGRESFRLALTATPNLLIHNTARPYMDLRHYRMLAAPAIMGDSAYVDTGLGLVCAVDLQDECVRWSRIYKRQFDEVGAPMRVATTPIVGERNVLFMPVDSTWLMLVNRETGAIVRRYTDQTWTSVGRCGTESIAVTTPSSVQILSLSGTDGSHALDMPKRLHVAALADGCLLAGGGEITVLDAQGKPRRTQKLPAGVSPSFLDDAGHLWGWAGADGLVWGRLDDSEARVAVRLATTAAGSGLMLMGGDGWPFRQEVEPSLSSGMSGPLLTVRNLAARLDTNGRLSWETPLAPSATMAAAGHRFVATMCGRLWVWDDADGKVASVWPPLMMTPGDQHVVTSGSRDEVVYAMTALPNGHGRIWDFGKEARSAPVPLMDIPWIADGACVDLWVQPCATQTLAVTFTRQNYNANVFGAPRFNGSATDAPPEAVHLLGCNLSASTFDAERRNLDIVTGGKVNENIHITAAGMTRTTEQRPGDSWSSVFRMGELLGLWYKEGVAHVMNPASGGFAQWPAKEDNRPDFPPWNWVSGVGKDIVGLRQHNGRLMLFRQDITKAKEPGQGVERLELDGPAPVAGDEWRGAVSLGNGSLLLMTSPKAEMGQVTRGHIWQRGASSISTVLLPVITHQPQQITPDLWRIGDEIFSCADWRDCLALDKRVQPLPATTNFPDAASVTVDGFVDEWRADEFLAIPQGWLAVRREGSGDKFMIALDLTSPEVVAAVAAATDLKASSRLCMCTGNQFPLDFVRENARPVAAELMNQNQNGGRFVRQFACQVAPDARRATIEMEVCAGGLPTRKKGSTLSEKEKTFGDLTICMFFSDPAKGFVYLVGENRPGPLGCLRLRLPSQ